MKRTLLAASTALLLALIPGLARGEERELWVGVGPLGHRVASEDGTHWGKEQWAREQGDLRSVAYGLGRFIAVGGYGSHGLLLASRDGEAWEELPAPAGQISSIAFGQDRFLAAQGTQLLISTDGQTFTLGAKIETPAADDLPTGTEAERRFAEGLEQQGELRVCDIAAGDTEAGFRFVILGGVDCLERQGLSTLRGGWRAVVGDGTRIEHFAPAAEASALAYGAGHFVVVGKGWIESSHDGQTWVRHLIPEGAFYGVIWTGTRFLASAPAGLWSSPDALTWAREEQAQPCCLAWGRDLPYPLYFGWNEQKEVITSTDLATWRPLVLGQKSHLEAIAHRPASR